MKLLPRSNSHTHLYLTSSKLLFLNILDSKSHCCTVSVYFRHLGYNFYCKESKKIPFKALEVNFCYGNLIKNALSFQGLVLPGKIATKRRNYTTLRISVHIQVRKRLEEEKNPRFDAQHGPN